MKINRKILSFISIAIYTIFIFLTSLIASISFLGHSTVGIISKARPFALKDNSEALVTSFKVNNKLIDDWQTVKEENTEEYKYISAVGRYYTYKIEGKEINILESKTEVHDQYYSFMHVYCGTEKSWKLLQEPNSIIISRETQVKCQLNIGDEINLSNKNGQEITLTVVGICDGQSNSSKQFTGNIFADVFGFFGFIAENSIESLEDGYFQRIQTKMTNRQLSLKFDKWYKLRDKYDFDYTISSITLENNLKFCDTFKNNKMRYFIGTGLLIIDFALIVFVWIRKEKTILFIDDNHSKKIYKFLPTLVYIFLWLFGLLVTKNRLIEYEGFITRLRDINSYTINSAIMILASFIVLLPLLKKLKNWKKVTKEVKYIYYEIEI